MQNDLRLATSNSIDIDTLLCTVQKTIHLYVPLFFFLFIIYFKFKLKMR